MVKKWVNDSFKSILQDNCQAYLESNDLGKHKARTQLINEVAEKIREAAPGSDLPADLNKSVTIWFGNEAKRVVGGDADSGTKSKTKGRKNKPGKQWNKRLVAVVVHSDRFNEIYQQQIQEYSGEGQANLRTYASSVTTLMAELTAEEVEECQELAEVWNKEPVPKKVQQKATKRLPALVKRFMATAQREMGATVFMLVSYRNPQGAGSYSAFETMGSTFTEEKPNWRYGPGNVLDMWRDWADDYDSSDDVEEDGDDDDGEKGEDALVLAWRKEDKFPLLPAFNSDTPLDMLKRILRVYVREVRKFQRLSGRIPWAAIRANNDAHIVKKCQRTKYILEDPSRMGQKAVTSFLNHWLTRQEAGKDWPLKFLRPDPAMQGKRKSRVHQEDDAGGDDDEVGTGRADEGGEDEDPGSRGGPVGNGKEVAISNGARDDGEVQLGSGDEGGNDEDQGSQRGPVEKGKEVPKDIIDMPGTPDKADTPPLRKLFLRSLSKAAAYQKLIGLLDSADPDVNVEAIGRPGPDWGHWGYSQEFLPAAFHNRKGPGSFPSVLTWVKGKPLAIFEGQAPGYHRVEKTLLVLGLTLRELDRVLFSEPDDCEGFPPYLQKSNLTISDWTKMVERLDTLLSDVVIHSESISESGDAQDQEMGSPGTSGKPILEPGQQSDKAGGIDRRMQTKGATRPGVMGIPALFSAIRGDLGLLHPDWEWLGPEWHTFVRKWLCAETALAKSGGAIVSAPELQETDLPPLLKLWGVAQINKASFDQDIVTEEFGKEMLSWWDGLGLKRNHGADHILSFPWCRNGKAGVVMLVLGMRWWADKSGGGKQWVRVLKEMTIMWELISAAPNLVRNTRSKGGVEAGIVPPASPARATRSKLGSQPAAIAAPSPARGKRGRTGEQIGNVPKKARR